MRVDCTTIAFWLAEAERQRTAELAQGLVGAKPLTLANVLSRAVLIADDEGNDDAEGRIITAIAGAYATQLAIKAADSQGDDAKADKLADKLTSFVVSDDDGNEIVIVPID